MNDSPASERAAERQSQRQVDRAHARAARLALRPLLLAAGIYHLALGLFQAVAPQDFFDQIGPYSPYNDHYIRDVSTFYLALGAIMVVAAARRSWQVPILAFAVVQYALHFVNHLVDVGDTDPGWVGFANAIALALIGVALFWLMRTAQIEDRK